MALNAMDGMLAREFGQQSALGGYLNEITDIAADAALYLPFAFIAPFGGVQIALFIWLAAMTEVLRRFGTSPWQQPALSDGPFGKKSDRAFFIGALSVWYAIATGSFVRFSMSLMWLARAALVYTYYKLSSMA